MNRALTDSEIKQQLREYIDQFPAFKAILRCLPALELQLQGSVLRFSFKYPCFAPFYEKNYRALFERLIPACFTEEICLLQADSAFSPPRLEKPKSDPLSDSLSDPFGEFIASEANRPALEAARQLSQNKAGAPGFLLVTGAPGSGKSCLLRLTGNAFVSRYGDKAVAQGRALAFRPKLAPHDFWDGTRVLILDDIQETGANPALQSLLAAFIDEGLQTSGKIVLAFCGTDPAIFSSRLNRRLEQALRMELFCADLATRIAYAEKASQNLGLNLHKSQIIALARYAPKISALSGLLQKLKFHDMLGIQPLSPEELEKLALPAGTAPGWRKILQQVGERLNVSLPDMVGQSRRHELVVARQAAMLLCRNKLGLSYPELGRIFGGRDHSTIIHGIRKIQQLRKTDKIMHNLLTELEQGND